MIALDGVGISSSYSIPAAFPNISPVWVLFFMSQNNLFTFSLFFTFNIID